MYLDCNSTGHGIRTLPEVELEQERTLDCNKRGEWDRTVVGMSLEKDRAWD